MTIINEYFLSVLFTGLNKSSNTIKLKAKLTEELGKKTRKKFQSDYLFTLNQRSS